MWFFVSTLGNLVLLSRCADVDAADVPGEERWSGAAGLESPLGPWRTLGNLLVDEGRKLHGRWITYITHCIYTRGVRGRTVEAHKVAGTLHEVPMREQH